MITEATTTQDLIATFGNARPLSEVSFEEGCTVLNAIELFDRRAAGGKVGTWLEYSFVGRNALRFVPMTDAWHDLHTHRLVCEKLAQDVVSWTCRQLDSSELKIGAAFTAWVVIDRATRVTWVECSPVPVQNPRWILLNYRALHPRSLREACEFPSSSRGTASAHVLLHTGETWRAVLDRVLDAYYEAKDLFDAKAKTVSLPREEIAAPDLHVTDGAVGIRTSQLVEPAHIRTLKVSGEGSVGIDLDDGDGK